MESKWPAEELQEIMSARGLTPNQIRDTKRGSGRRRPLLAPPAQLREILGGAM